MKKRLLLFLFSMLTMVSAWADSFIVDGINYQTNWNDETTVYVTSNDPKYEGDIVIPASVTYEGKTYGVMSIESYAFDGCSGLTSITIPDGVTSIGNGAFYECSGLTSISIPDGVTSIGKYAFYRCSSLTRVDYGGNIADWLKIEFDYSDSNPLCYAHHLYIDGEEVTEVVVTDDVTSIGNYAFYNCSGLTSITIPVGVTNIGDYTFFGCSNLTSITIPDGVTSIGYRAFNSCKSLTSIVIPNSMTEIGDCTFIGCSGLTSITIADGVTSIGEYAFSACSGLTFVYIPESVTSLGEKCFFSCNSLTSITIPKNVTNIGDEAFSNSCFGSSCSKLTSVTMESKIPPTLGNKAIPSGITLIVPSDALDDYMTAYGNSYLYSTIEGDAIYGKGWEYDKVTKTLSIYENVSSNPWSQFKSEIVNVEFSDEVTSIGSSAFSGCVGLTSITIPNSVTSIGSSAFSNCVGLTSVVIPESVTSIGSSAFSDCSGLTSISIPESVTKIDNYAFSGCEGIASILIPKSVKEIGINIVSRCVNLTSIKVDKENEFFDSRNSCNAIIMTEKNVVKAGCRKTILPEGIEYIATSAFENISGLKKVIIPEGVKRIGNFCFMNCSDIDFVYIPSTIEKIDDFCTFCDEDAKKCICKEVYIASKSPIEISSITFAATKENILHVPVGCKEAYEAAEYWSDFTIVEGLDLPDGIEEISIGKKLNKAIKTIDNGRVVIIVDGKKFDISGRKIE